MTITMLTYIAAIALTALCSVGAKKGFKAMINYCPVEKCRSDGTWSIPSLSCAETECYDPSNSQAFKGRRICTASGKLCQRWDTQHPQKHRFRKTSYFPDPSVSEAGNFCRDPDGTRGAPWCFINESGGDKRSEFCNILPCEDNISSTGSCSNTRPVSAEEKQEVEEGVEEPEMDPAQCKHGMTYGISKRVRPRSPGTWNVPMRSLIECASLCTRKKRCQSFAYSDENTCILYNMSSDVTTGKLISDDHYRHGVKVCLS